MRRLFPYFVLGKRCLHGYLSFGGFVVELMTVLLNSKNLIFAAQLQEFGQAGG